MIYVGPSPSGFCIFKADGNYEGAGSPAFRAGDVFARHGSASEPWAQTDIARIVRMIVAREKESWRQEYRDELRRVTSAAGAQEIARAPAEALTWRMDADAFIAAVVEQIRSDDEIPLRLLLTRVGGDVGALVERSDAGEELGTLLDRLACLAATLLLIERQDLFDRVVQTLVAIYDLGFDQEGLPRRNTGISAPGLWLMVVERVFALGSMAVRQEEWGAVRSLGLRVGHGRDFTDDYNYNSWIRHAITMASRSNLFRRDEEGRAIEVSLLSLALQHMRREACLRPGFGPDDERLLNNLCQFDALACLLGMGEGSLSSRFFYPNFARFYTHRSQPALARVVEDPAVRQIIFPLGNDDLAEALRGLDATSTQIGFQFNGWHGFTDRRNLQFLEAHPRRNQA